MTTMVELSVNDSRGCKTTLRGRENNILATYLFGNITIRTTTTVCDTYSVVLGSTISQPFIIAQCLQYHVST